MAERVVATPAAEALIAKLRALHGELLFHQSGGCCAGSAPICFPYGGFRVGAHDEWLGTFGGCAFFIGAAQFAYWEHTQIILDVVPGRGSGFSLEGPEGVCFLSRGRVLSEAEVADLRQGAPPPRGDRVIATAP